MGTKENDDSASAGTEPDRVEEAAAERQETAAAAEGADGQASADGTAAADAVGSEAAAASQVSADGGSGAEVQVGSIAEGTTEPAKSAASGKLSRLAGLRIPRGRAVRVTARAAVALVLAAAVGTGIHFYQQDKDHREVLQAQDEARQAACAYGPVVSTYDSKHLDQYVAKVLAGATGEWRKQFESNSKDLSDVLAKGEVVAKSTDVQCAIRTADKNSAEAIVVIGQTITSLGTQGKPEPGQLSTVMRLQKQGDRWLVDKINTPLGPAPQS